MAEPFETVAARPAQVPPGETPRVFLASRNSKKIEEMQRILREHAPDLDVLGIAKNSRDEKIAARKKNANTAIDRMVIVTVNRIVASIPTMLIPTKIT